MKITETENKYTIEGLSKFRLDTLLRCLAAINENTIQTAWEPYPIYGISDEILAVEFSEDERAAIEAAAEVLGCEPLNTRPVWKQEEDEEEGLP